MTGFSLTLLGNVLTLLPTDKNLLAQEDCVSEVFLKSRCWPAWKQPMVSESRRSSAIKLIRRLRLSANERRILRCRLASLILIITLENAASQVSERR